jgi:hypothetical protein
MTMNRIKETNGNESKKEVWIYPFSPVFNISFVKFDMITNDKDSILQHILIVKCYVYWPTNI